MHSFQRFLIVSLIAWCITGCQTKSQPRPVADALPGEPGLAGDADQAPSLKKKIQQAQEQPETPKLTP